MPTATIGVAGKALMIIDSIAKKVGNKGVAMIASTTTTSTPVKRGSDCASPPYKPMYAAPKRRSSAATRKAISNSGALMPSPSPCICIWLAPLPCRIHSKAHADVATKLVHRPSSRNTSARNAYNKEVSNAHAGNQPGTVTPAA